jgi:hypothetical protein
MQFSMLNYMPVNIKIVGGRGSAPNPAAGAYDAPPDPLIGFSQALRAIDSRASCARFKWRFMKTKTVGQGQDSWSLANKSSALVIP